MIPGYLNLIQNPIPNSGTMSSYYVGFFSAERAYFQGDLMVGSEKYIWTFRLEFRQTSAFVWENSLLTTEMKDHAMKGAAYTDYYMFRVSEGTCTDSGGSQFQGLMLTGLLSPTLGSSWSYNNIVLDCAVCINPQDSAITSILGSTNTYSVFDVLAMGSNASDTNAIIFLQETSANEKFFIFFLEDCSNGNFEI